jgi:hypothetical protein
MSPKIIVLINQCRVGNHYLIITRIVQSDLRYCQYNNESADKMILPLFPTYLRYCELLW